MDFDMFASLPASDIGRARQWYQDKLGIKPVDSAPEGVLMYMQGANGFIVYPSDFAGTNQATAAGLAVKDFDAAASELRSNGVVFEEYDMGEDFQTVDGVMTDSDGNKIAWFKDSEGNILSLTSDPRG